MPLAHTLCPAASAHRTRAARRSSTARTITLANRQGYVIFKSVQDIASGLVIAQQQATQVDDFDRPVAETNLDGTTELTVYNCCQVESRVDGKGIQTTYDDAPGVKTRASLGLMWKDKTEGRE